MLAFSGCYYGGGEKERNELGEIRKRWATLPVRLPSFKTFDLDILTVMDAKYMLFFTCGTGVYEYTLCHIPTLHIYTYTIIQSEHPFQPPIEAV